MQVDVFSHPLLAANATRSRKYPAFNSTCFVEISGYDSIHISTIIVDCWILVVRSNPFMGNLPEYEETHGFVLYWYPGWTLNLWALSLTNWVE